MSDAAYISEIRKRALSESHGDIDSIWAYGSHAQSELSDFSKTMAMTVAASNVTEYRREVDHSIATLNSSQTEKSRFGRKKRGGSLQQIQETICEMDELTLELRLWQAQILKELKIFERMQELIGHCSEELDIYIEVGENRVKEATSAEDEDLQGRLERKISELRTSRIIAIQSKEQASLMCENNRMLGEKIGALLATTIPLWRDQIVIEYGLEQYNESQKLHKTIMDVSEKSMKENMKRLQASTRLLKKNNKKEIDEETVQNINDKLEKSLQNLLITEKEMQGSIEKMKQILNTEKTTV